MQEQDILSDNTFKKCSDCRDVPVSVSFLTRPFSSRSEVDCVNDVLCIIDEKHRPLPEQFLA